MAKAAGVSQEATRASQAQPIRGIVGLWVWRATDYESNAAREELIEFSKKWGYNRLLVQVHRQRSGDRNALLLPGNVKATPFAAQTSPTVNFAPTMIGITGQGIPHENRQPLLALNFCIALAGVFPQRP